MITLAVWFHVRWGTLTPDVRDGLCRSLVYFAGRA